MDRPDAPASTADEALRTLGAELERGLRLIGDAASLDALEEAETAALGRRSAFAAVQRGLRELGDADRREVGRRTNEVRSALQDAVAARREALERRLQEDLLGADRVDLTLPGRRPGRGGLHPMTVVERQLVAAFVGMGYRVAEGPEIEDDWHNFQALNIPPDHPARTMKDTLYVQDGDWVFRTETSAVQVRTMESQQPPVYVVAPGRVFRRDVTDATHSPVFTQIEGLAVDEGLSFAHLKGTLEEFARAAFGPTRRVRLIPSFFPFTEPSAELDVSCFACDGAGCRICGTGWIEIGGCGMVHPAVFEAVGYDPERYTGFAFGMGIERVALVRYAIPDIRLLYQGDQRFLRQFRGAVA